MNDSWLEKELFEQLSKEFTTDELRSEYTFLKGRKYRADFALPDYKILIEAQGGTWSTKGHANGKSIQRDYEKVNAAQCAGWIILLFTGDDIQKGVVIDRINDAIVWREKQQSEEEEAAVLRYWEAKSAANDILKKFCEERYPNIKTKNAMTMVRREFEDKELSKKGIATI